MSRTLLISTLTAIALSLAFFSHADEKTADGGAGSTASNEAIAKSLSKLVFVPHDSGAPVVTESGGVRAVTVLPKVQLLAPRRMARTLAPNPTLYWHISKAAIGNLWFTLVVDDSTVINPLLEIRVDGVDQEGIYSVNLDDHNISLEPGQRYIWSLVLSTESSGFGSDQVAQSLLEHTPDPELHAKLGGLTPQDRTVRLAAEGYWYDAIQMLSDQIGVDVESPWKTARAQLLDEAGLLQAARFDRR